MDQDKTTVMGGYGSAQAGDSADATCVVPNPGYADPAATQPSAEPTRVMGYGDTAQDSYAASSQGPYGNAVPDPFDYAPQDSYAASTPNPYDDLPQNPIPQPQQTTYMPRTAQPRYESREPYREYPKSIPQYGEDEERKPSRSSSVIKKILIVLAIFFALSIVFAIVSGMLNKRGSSTADATAEQTESASSSTVDLSDIPGQYWSNAKKILKSRGADLSNAVVLTDDGSTPVVDANWVVTSAYYNDNGNLEIQLTHKNRQLELQYAGGLEQQGAGVGRQGARAGRYGTKSGRYRAELGRHGDGCLERPTKRHLGRAGKLAVKWATAARPDGRAS